MANRMAAVVSEDSGAFTMGSLFGELGGELTRQNVSDITEALITEGMDERTARKNARILWYVVKNGPVSRAQAQMIEGNDILAKVMREVIIDPYCTVDPQSIGYNEILRRLARETVARESGYHFGMWNPSPAGSTAGGAGGRVWMSQGGDNAAAAAFVPQGEGFGSGWQETRGASAERNGAKLEAAQGAGADTLGAGSSFEQRQTENAADWETTEDLPVEESAEHGIIDRKPQSAMAAVKKIPDAKERSRVINEAINAKIPVYADDLRAAYRYVKPKEGFKDICLHGKPHYTTYEHRYVLDTETLYLIISGRSDFQKQDIRLLSCKTGEADRYGNCVAQELADRLGVAVYAPIDTLYIHVDGRLTVGRKHLSEKEGFKLFLPRLKGRTEQ